MSAPFDSTKYALEDDELDALLSGALDPRSIEPPGNPVASFFHEARHVRFAGHPRPDERLARVFAGAPGRQAAGAVGARQADGEATGVLSAATVRRRPSPAAPNGNGDPLGPIGSGEISPAGAPGPIEAGQISPARSPRRPRSLPSEPTQRYRTSPIEVLIATIRPTPTKLLMGMSLLLAAVIALQALGLLGLGSADDLQQVASVASTASTSSSVAEEATTVASPVETTTTLSSSTTTIAAARVATTPAPAVETTTPTIETTTPTIPTSETTTPTIPTSETTIDSQPTVTLPVDSSVPSSETVPDTTEPSTTTEPPTTAPATVIVARGIPLSVPANLPAGIYRAQVEGVVGCAAEIIGPDGTVSTLQAAVGAEFAFVLVDGATITTGAGCPQVFRFTPA